MKPGASGPWFSLPCDLLVLLHLHRAVGTRRVWCLLPHTPSLALPVQLFPASCPGPSCLSLVSFTPRGPRLGCCHSWVVWPRGGCNGSQLLASLVLTESCLGLGSFCVQGHTQRVQTWSALLQKHELCHQG